MQQLSRKFWSSKNSTVNFSVITCFLIALVLGCGGGSSTPSKPIPAAYLGDWTAQDGTKLTIRNDGTGDYNAGSSKVNGAAVEIDEAAKELKFTMLGVDVGKYKIDAPPTGNQMKLNGTQFKRSGGFAADDTDKAPLSIKGDKNGGSPNTGSDDGVPSESEAKDLAVETLRAFNDAAQSGDFEDFSSTQIATAVQGELTADKLKNAFAQFTTQKIDITPKAGANITFSPKPSFGSEGTLDLVGSYPSAKGQTVNFDLKYIDDNGEQKITAIRVKVL